MQNTSQIQLFGVLSVAVAVFFCIFWYLLPLAFETNLASFSFFIVVVAVVVAADAVADVIVVVVVVVVVVVSGLVLVRVNYIRVAV